MTTWRGGMRTVAAGLAVAVVTSALTVSPEPAAGREAAPTWGPIHRLATQGYGPDVAVDANGNTTVVWSMGSRWPQGSARVTAVRRPAGGSWGTPVTIGRGESPQVAVDARGNVTVVWVSTRQGVTDGLTAVRRPAGGPWGRPVRISTDRPASHYGPTTDDEGAYGAQDPELAVSPGGAVVVSWIWGSYDRDKPFRVQAAFRSQRGPWLPARTLTAPRTWTEVADVAVDGRGNAVLVWSNDTGLKARRRVVGQGWTAPALLDKRGGNQSAFDVAADPAGNFVAAYVPDGRERVFTVRRPVGGPWLPARAVTPRDVRAASPRVFLDAGGTSTVTWVRRSGRIDAVRRPPGGAWSAPVQVGAINPRESWVGEDVELAGNPAGDLLLTWPRWGIRGSYRAHDGAWSAVSQITGGTKPVGERASGLYPRGDSIVVWSRSEWDPGPILVRRMTAP